MLEGSADDFNMLLIQLSPSRFKRMTADFMCRLLTSSFHETVEHVTCFADGVSVVASDAAATSCALIAVEVQADASTFDESDFVTTVWTCDGTISKTFPFCTATELTFGNSLRTGLICWIRPPDAAKSL